jgi:hypothetical protein
MNAILYLLFIKQKGADCLESRMPYDNCNEEHSYMVELTIDFGWENLHAVPETGRRNS